MPAKTVVSGARCYLSEGRGKIKYYVDTRWNTVYRSPNRIDDKVWNGVTWAPTNVLIEWRFGHNDFVDEITEAEARELEPAAFSR